MPFLITVRFQSTLLIRRATISINSRVGWSNFNPRSSYEERPHQASPRTFPEISIHAPHTKSDDTDCRQDQKTYFNPRSSYEERRRTVYAWVTDVISIHAPHTKSDGNPAKRYAVVQFQSTLLIRRATWISYTTGRKSNFNPRSSYEERPKRHILQHANTISIHAPHTKSDAIKSLLIM